MIPAMYADNPTRSLSVSFRGIAGRGTAMKAMVRDRNDIKYIDRRIGHFKHK